jgi:glutamate-ammonia-ligase adenylyltransferase
MTGRDLDVIPAAPADWPRIGPTLGAASGPQGALDAARPFAPYLERLCQRRPATHARLAGEAPMVVVRDALAAAAGAGALDDPEAMAVLRQAKADVHLALAAGDLAGLLDVEAVTGALSELADAAARAALKLACRAAPPRDQATFDAEGAAPGLFLVAMGKHGAGELNYSSDIDLTAFFDRDAFAPEHRDAAGGVCVRLVRTVSRILEDVTPDGYVFRVDWRLRPDPGSTQVAVSVQAAEPYYESVGQNWERAALIKARTVAGDARAAGNFLRFLTPFIWRKSLDFAAIGDVQSILRQIHAVRRSANLDDPAFDVKLGRGGIREIEFFAQTQQLILGGRDPLLRVRGTLAALDRLVETGRIQAAVRDDLAAGYRLLRMIEHRIQMLDDEQTHRLPADPARRARVAALCGFEGVEALDALVRHVRERVRARVADLFPDSAALSADTGSLVFTGVEDDPETLSTLRALGFADPSKLAATVRGWHHGRIPATRTARARELLTALTPALLKALSETGEPDAAFARFQDFFSSLRAGVQVLSLFTAEPLALSETCLTLALSPKLADALARRPAILDAMLAPHFAAPLESDAQGARVAAFDMALAGREGFEDGLDRARRVHREEAFRIGFQILHGRAKADAAGPAFTDLAEATIGALLPVARAELEAAHGSIRGQVAICGWGKLGGRELAADSDLDLMIVYDAEDEESDGRRPLSAEAWHARLTQRLVAALSAPTAEGSLYDVDMQLRPSGRAGPVAVRASALERYYEGEAWTWEFQALTRLRPVAGDPALMARIERVAARALGLARDARKTRDDIVAMRARIAEAHRPRGPLDLKRLPGGLVDLEFLAQHHQLVAAGEGEGHLVSPNTLEALERLGQAGRLPLDAARRLIEAGRTLHDARQILAVASGPALDPAQAARGLREAIARTLDAPDIEQATARLDDARARIAAAWAAFAAA